MEWPKVRRRRGPVGSAHEVEEVEDEEHFLLRCEGWRQRREMLAGILMNNLVGEFCTATDNDDWKVALILDQACSNGRVGKAVEKIWQCRFLQSACLTCMVVPVFPVSCLYLIPI